MCKWGDSVVLDVEVPASLSCTGEARRKAVGVDKCIADMVRALNDGGVKTVASCCGHGKIPGTIILADDQHLLLLDRTTAHEVITAYGVTIHGGSVARDGDAGDDDAASVPDATGFVEENSADVTEFTTSLATGMLKARGLGDSTDDV